ncbi:MAG: hypothetical protein JRE43_05730 [Deltaproteobacteria bacterium]|jgi:hypothetical protein|nr:hypothetical protein [Deltaproteobacteria bacterium]MBW2540492.1 hypothetical protein [Deltaproteobacteria bacterium]
MRAAFRFTATFATGIIAFGFSSCAGKSENAPTILEGMDSTTESARVDALDPRSGELATKGRAHLPYRGPDPGGIAYRLTLEVDGQRAAFNSSERNQQPAVRETQALEADFRKLPVEGAGSNENVFLVGLDSLRYTQKQQNPPLDREIEIADDRLRIRLNGETSIDNRGNRVTGTLAPRIFLGRIFGVITHDPTGNPTNLSSRGAPAARQFMDGFPTLAAIAYAMITLPEEPIAAGSSWTGVRIPPSRSGELGLGLTIDYTLTGFEIFEGVPCALILLASRVDEKAVTSVTGHPFDQVQATLNGTAWVELENSLVRRVVLSDQIRASWTDSLSSVTPTQRRIEHASKLVLALRDPAENPKHWADGTPQFDSH